MPVLMEENIRPKKMSITQKIQSNGKIPYKLIIKLWYEEGQSAQAIAQKTAYTEEMVQNIITFFTTIVTLRKKGYSLREVQSKLCFSHETIRVIILEIEKIQGKINSPYFTKRQLQAKLKTNPKNFKILYPFLFPKNPSAATPRYDLQKAKEALDNLFKKLQNNCQICGNRIYSLSNHRVTCSSKCAKEYRKRILNNKKLRKNNVNHI